MLENFTPGGGSKLMRRLGNQTCVQWGMSSRNQAVEGSHRSRKQNRVCR